jgi:hypothetical protein
VSNLPDVIAGVIEALAEAGETLTLRRYTVVQDPLDPTGPGTQTVVDRQCRGYVGPVTRFDTANRVPVTTNDVLIDPLSIAGNTAAALTVISQAGDVVIDGSGKEWVMTQDQHPRLEGRIAVFWHSGVA